MRVRLSETTLDDTPNQAIILPKRAQKAVRREMSLKLWGDLTELDASQAFIGSRSRTRACSFAATGPRIRLR